MGDFDNPLGTATPMWWSVRDPLLVPDSARPAAGDRKTLTAEELLKRAVLTTDPIRATRDRWADSLRGTVRDHPLVFVAGALAIGALLARIRR